MNYLKVILVMVAFAGCGTVPPVLRPDDTARQSDLYRVLLERDAVLFDAVFSSCNLEVVGSLVTDDFEFYHDEWGKIAGSKAEFVGLIGEQCGRQHSGVDFKARRELDAGTVTVYPMGDYGAVQMGIHRFFRIEAGKADRPTEVARLIHLWKEDNGQWKLARVISYDHEDIQ